MGALLKGQSPATAGFFYCLASETRATNGSIPQKRAAAS